MRLDEAPAILRRELPYLRSRFGARFVAVFGSFATGEQTPESDLDILVDFERPIGWEIVDLEGLFRREARN